MIRYYDEASDTYAETIEDVVEHSVDHRAETLRGLLAESQSYTINSNELIEKEEEIIKAAKALIKAFNGGFIIKLEKV